jgi:hypothetical protein
MASFRKGISRLHVACQRFPTPTAFSDAATRKV